MQTSRPRPSGGIQLLLTRENGNDRSASTPAGTLKCRECPPLRNLYHERGLQKFAGSNLNQFWSRYALFGVSVLEVENDGRLVGWQGGQSAGGPVTWPGGWLSETEGDRFLGWGSVWIGIWFEFCVPGNWARDFFGKDCMWVRVRSVVISGMLGVNWVS